MQQVGVAEGFDHERLEPAGAVESEKTVDRRPHGHGAGLHPRLVRLRERLLHGAQQQPVGEVGWPGQDRRGRILLEEVALEHQPVQARTADGELDVDAVGLPEPLQPVARPDERCFVAGDQVFEAPRGDDGEQRVAVGEMPVRRGAGPVVLPDRSVWARDARIKAAVVAAPALGYTFDLSAVNLPIQLWRAEDDHILPGPDYAEAVRKALPRPPEYHVVKGADHMDFLTPCTDALRKAAPDICDEIDGFDRTAFHAQFNRDVIAFFQRELR